MHRISRIPLESLSLRGCFGLTDFCLSKVLPPLVIFNKPPAENPSEGNANDPDDVEVSYSDSPWPCTLSHLDLSGVSAAVA